MQTGIPPNQVTTELEYIDLGVHNGLRTTSDEVLNDVKGLFIDNNHHLFTMMDNRIRSITINFNSPIDENKFYLFRIPKIQMSNYVAITNTQQYATYRGCIRVIIREVIRYTGMLKIFYNFEYFQTNVYEPKAFFGTQAGVNYLDKAVGDSTYLGGTLEYHTITNNRQNITTFDDTTPQTHKEPSNGMTTFTSQQVERRISEEKPSTSRLSKLFKLLKNRRKDL